MSGAISDHQEAEISAPFFIGRTEHAWCGCGYPERKLAHGLSPIRDWTWTGRTLRSLKVKSASENHCVIGFIDPNADRMAHVNNLRERAFGVSLKDCEALNAFVLITLKDARVIRASRAS